MSEVKATSTAPTASWFTLAMACRWPLALVLSAWALAVAAIQILREPIPIALSQDQPFPVRLVGDLKIDSLRQPVSIQGAEALQIQAADTLPVQGQVDVKGDVDIAGNVTVDAVRDPVSVQGEDAGPVLVGTSQDQPVQVDVSGGIDVNQVNGKINVQLRNAAKSMLPIP